MMNLEEGERFMCLATPFIASRIDGGAKISIKSSFMEIIFIICTFDRSDVPGENTSFRSKTADSSLLVWEKSGKGTKQTIQLCVSDIGTTLPIV